MNLLISTAIGACISLMLLFNGNLSNIYGNYITSIIIHTVGLFSITILIFIKKSSFKACKNIPWYFYSAGGIGIITVIFNNIAFSKLGVAITLAVSLLGQALTSIIIDHYGLFGLDIVKFRKEKLIGIFLVVLGIIIMTIF